MASTALRPTVHGRTIASLTAALLVVALAVALPVQAAADTSPPPSVPATVSADPLPTVQIDGVAWSQVVVGNTVYVTGSFAFARPAGTPANSPSRVARANLLAYDITTGNLITGFNHTLNAQGRSITASPDGSRVYVAGNFTTVDGIAHNRIAAFDTATGALIPGFAGLNNTTLAITASNSAVYVGGSFTTAGGNARNRLAAYSSTGALLPWNPAASATVTAMTVSPDASRVIVGGQFTTLAGVARNGIGSVFATANGASAPWADDFPIKDSGTSSNLTSLSADGTNIYGTGYYFTQGGNFEGRFAANPTTGQIIWMNTCHGDSYDAVPIGNILYSASHEHDCSDIGSFSQDDPGPTTSTHHFLAAETIAATGTLRKPIFPGGNGVPGPTYADFSGQPSSTQLMWYPTLLAGTYTGQSQAAWSIAGNPSYLSVGGEFPSAEGVAQQGLVRYAIGSIAPNKIGPTTVTAPTAVSQADGTLRVAWRAAQDVDNATLKYELLRDGGATPIYTTTFSGSFYQRPMLGYTDTGLTRASSHTYRIRVTDPFGNTVTSAASPAAVVGSATRTAYTTLVRTDGASNFWPLNESSGSTARDLAGYADLTTRSAVTFGAAGPIAGNGTAATFSGTVISTPAPAPPPGFPPRPPTITSNSVAATAGDVLPLSAFTVEAWVRTTSTTGGAFLSDSLYAPDSGRQSPTMDRVLYFANNGTINFGLFSDNTNQSIGSTSAYNDGAWHLVNATAGSSGAVLYVDGVQVAANAALRSTSVFVGHWRLGGDSFFGWPVPPTSGYLAGSIADAAVYPAVLSAVRIQAHAAAGGTTPPANAAPVASFTSSCSNLTCSFNAAGSSDPDGTVTGYAWNFGDGTTGTGATPAHPYATAGTYSVTLTVTDNGGATGATSNPVSPTAPAGTTPFATDTFNRTVTGGFGTADLGGTWTTSPAARYAVGSAAGLISITTAGATSAAYLNGAVSSSTDLTLSLALDKVPSATAYLDVIGRRVAVNQEYDGLVKVTSSGAVQLNLRKLSGSATAVNFGTAATVVGLTYTAGTQLNVRLQVEGTGTTTLRMKAWANGTAEPAAWLVTGTDTSAGLQAAGSVGLRTYLSSSATNTPIVQSVRSLTAKPVG